MNLEPIGPGAYCRPKRLAIGSNVGLTMILLNESAASPTPRRDEAMAPAVETLRDLERHQDRTPGYDDWRKAGPARIPVHGPRMAVAPIGDRIAGACRPLTEEPPEAGRDDGVGFSFRKAARRGSIGAPAH